MANHNLHVFAFLSIAFLVFDTAVIRPASGQQTVAHVGSYRQEIALHRQRQTGLPSPDVRSVHVADGGRIVAVTAKGAAIWNGQGWQASAMSTATVPDDAPPGQIRQTATDQQGNRAAATSRGLFEKAANGDWLRVDVQDGLGRAWATSDVRGVTYGARDQLWFATRAGVGCRTAAGWRFFEGKDGLPYNDFSCCMADPSGSIWFGTRRGAIRFDGTRWSYRQGRAWLPHDHVRDIAIAPDGTAWLATPEGIGCITFRTMTLADKAEHYESDIQKHIKRTSWGYVSEVRVAEAGKKQGIQQHDSDNDGLWTAMYGTGECFAFAATRSPAAGRRARKVFQALRFLQTVTQNAKPSPSPGYVARTVRPTSGPDPNQGRREHDQRMQATRDRLWKVYQPRWPTSADGNWYWKSDTSSDELDGHYFFYAQYFELLDLSAEERQEVRSVVRRLTDHLIEHQFTLTDHDGKPTRWANFRPEALNYDFDWLPERGLNSLSMLSYLAVAHHVTADPKYQLVFERLMRQHAYHTNAFVPKMQRGIGSGNQSDDEMAFMSFYNLLQYMPQKEKQLKLWKQFLAAFHSYWALEQPERNPFFHFCYAAHGQGQSIRDPFGETDLSPWGDWLEDSVQTLTGFPLDRFDWAHQNQHRIDLVRLPKQQGPGTWDINDGSRGMRVDGKVLPVEERFFAHWNTDPWRFDTGGDGRTLASGTVFLLPYYMGLYHGFLK